MEANNLSPQQPCFVAPVIAPRDRLKPRGNELPLCVHLSQDVARCDSSYQWGLALNLTL